MSLGTTFLYFEFQLVSFALFGFNCAKYGTMHQSRNLKTYVLAFGTYIIIIKQFNSGSMAWLCLRYSLHQLDLCLPELHLGHDSVVARDHVRLLGATISLASIDTSPSSAPPASTGFVSCSVAGVHSTCSQQRHSSIHSCRHASITATLFWRLQNRTNKITIPHIPTRVDN